MARDLFREAHPLPSAQCRAGPPLKLCPLHDYNRTKLWIFSVSFCQKSGCQNHDRVFYNTSTSKFVGLLRCWVRWRRAKLIDWLWSSKVSHLFVNRHRIPGSRVETILRGKESQKMKAGIVWLLDIVEVCINLLHQISRKLRNYHLNFQLTYRKNIGTNFLRVPSWLWTMHLRNDSEWTTE